MMFIWKFLNDLRCLKHTIQIFKNHMKRLWKSLYDLKQFGGMWYNCVNKYLLKKVIIRIIFFQLLLLRKKI